MENGYHTFPLGNINSCHIVHTVPLLIVNLSLGDQPIHHCRSYLLDATGAPMWRLNLHKSNAANKRLADGLTLGRMVLGETR